MKLYLQSLDEFGCKQGYPTYLDCPANIVEYLAQHEALTTDNWTGVSICSGYCTIRELCRALLMARDLTGFTSAKMRDFNPEDELAVELHWDLHPRYSQRVIFHVYE